MPFRDPGTIDRTGSAYISQPSDEIFAVRVVPHGGPRLEHGSVSVQAIGAHMMKPKLPLARCLAGLGLCFALQAQTSTNPASGNSRRTAHAECD